MLPGIRGEWEEGGPVSLAKKREEVGGSLLPKWPLSAPGFWGAKSCCIRNLQLSRLYSKSPCLASLSEYLPYLCPSPDAGTEQVTTSRSFPQPRTWVSPHLPVSAAGDPPEMLSVTYYTRVGFSLTNTFSIFVGDPKDDYLQGFCHSMWCLCADIKRCPLWVQAYS